MGEEAAAAPATRKSQIIEEEEDMEDVEEVDAFGGPADAAINFQDSQSSPVEVMPADDLAKTPVGPSGQDSKAGLAPPADLDSSPSHPPRSSSLRARSEAAESAEGDRDKDDVDTQAASAK